MKLVLGTGCTTFGIDIDDEDYNNYNEQEIRDIIIKIISKTDKEDLFSILESLIEKEGLYESLGQCDQCFDYVSRYTLDI